MTYRTICVPGFPNLFTLFGPYSPIGNNSIIENSERQIGYVMRCLELIASGRVRSPAAARRRLSSPPTS